MTYPHWRRKLWLALETIAGGERPDITRAQLIARMQQLATMPAERPAAMRAALERAQRRMEERGVPDEEAVEQLQAMLLAVDLLRPYKTVAL